MLVINIIIIILFTVLVAWNWYNLFGLDTKKKVIYIIVSTFLVYLITLITFQIAKGGVTYENKAVESTVKNVLVNVFTILNGLIVMPYISKIVSKISLEEITKEKANKKLIIILIVFLSIIIIEHGYLKSTLLHWAG